MEKKLILVNAVNFERMFWLVKDIMGYLTEEQKDETYVFWSQHEMKIRHITIKFALDRMTIKGYKPDACFGFTSWKMRDKDYPGTLMDYLDEELNKTDKINDNYCIGRFDELVKFEKEFNAVPTESEG